MDVRVKFLNVKSGCVSKKVVAVGRVVVSVALILPATEQAPCVQGVLTAVTQPRGGHPPIVTGRTESHATRETGGMARREEARSAATTKGKLSTG